MLRFEAIGRLGSDAKVENGKNGQYVTFRLAANEFKDDEPMWFTVNVKPEACKGILPYLKKGVMVRTSGRYKDEVYMTRENKPMIGRTISAIEVNFIDNGGNKSSQNQTGIVEGQRTTQYVQPQFAQATQPVYQQTAAQPVYQQPVYQQPVVQQPVYQPTAQPVPQQPTAQPVYQQPSQPQPVYGTAVEDDNLPF